MNREKTWESQCRDVAANCSFCWKAYNDPMLSHINELGNLFDFGGVRVMFGVRSGRNCAAHMINGFSCEESFQGIFSLRKYKESFIDPAEPRLWSKESISQLRGQRGKAMCVHFAQSNVLHAISRTSNHALQYHDLARPWVDGGAAQRSSQRPGR